MPRLLLCLVLLAFAALTALAVAEHGVIGIFTGQMQSSAGWQVLVDLVIALALVLVWIWRDARRLGRRPWPWLLLTLLSGSFGPLLYLLSRPSGADTGPEPLAHDQPPSPGSPAADPLAGQGRRDHARSMSR